MLLRRLFARDTPGPDSDLAFKSRGAEVSRLEGFSDAVFGFAITLLVISSKAPDTSTELLALRHAVLPFIASFTVLFFLWRAQFDFFRRYGLEDRRTIRLTGAFLMIVLLAVYPVKFLFTFALDVLPTAALGGSDFIAVVLPKQNVPKVMLMYSIGFAGVFYIFSRLYRHAARQHAELGLSALELFDTRVIEQRYMGMATGGTVLSTMCMLMILLPALDVPRDSASTWVFFLTFGSLITFRFLRRRTERRFALERRKLVADVAEAAPFGSMASAPVGVPQQILPLA